MGKNVYVKKAKNNVIANVFCFFMAKLAITPFYFVFLCFVLQNKY